MSAATAESLTEAVTLALRERLERLFARSKAQPLADELDRIAKRCSALPLLDARSADKILGYDRHGLPH